MTSNPRVLLGCDFFLKYSVRLARELADRNCPVMVLTRSHDQEFGGEAGAMRRYVDRLVGGRAEHRELPGRVRDPRAVPALRAARRSVRRFGPHVVHLQDWIVNDPRLVVAAGARPGRYAVTVHDPSTHPGDKPNSALKRTLRRALLRRAAVIFVHAEALREELIAVERPGAPVVVAPLPATEHVPGMDDGTARALPLPERPSLLFFGRISHYKGLDTLLEAMPRVWQRVPDASLTVAGKGPLPEHPALRDGRVSLRHEHVPEPELRDLYRGSTCVVLPYRQASQSGVASLARQHGRPLVVSDVGGLPELVTPETGRVVPPEDPAALAEALVEVLATPGLAESMGRRAFEAGSSTDAWSTVADRVLEAYERYLPS